MTETDELKKEINELPGKIQAHQNAMLEIARKRQEYTNENNVKIRAIEKDVLTAKADSGKPLYSNEQIRALEIGERISKEEEITANNKKSQELDDKWKDAQVQLEYLNNRFKAVRTIVQIITGQVAI